MGEARRLPFKVVATTGWDEQYHARNLEECNPFVKGWRSERYCPYPQQVVLRLDSKHRIRKIQMLSHAYLISSRIELFVGSAPYGPPYQLDTVKYQRLGYVSLANNETNNFKSRELKSVNVDKVGQFVMLMFHQNHINPLNLFNQVSLLAVNLIGSSLQDMSPGRNVSSNQDTLGAINRHVAVAPVDDLGFFVCQEPEMAALVRRLDERKRQAVDDEKFELAKTIKGAIPQLLKVGEVLCRLEVEKRNAVQIENYDTAQKIKDQKEKLRRDIHSQLRVSELLSGSLPAPSHSSSYLLAPVPSQAYNPILRQSLDAGQGGREDEERATMPLPAIPREEEGGVAMPPPAIPVASDSYLPPLSKSPNLVSQQQSPSHQSLPSHREEEEAVDTKQSTVLPSLSQRSHATAYLEKEVPPSPPPPTSIPDSLTEIQCNEAAIAIDVFGEDIVGLIYSKVYQHREEGLQSVMMALTSQDTQPHPHTLRGVGQLLKKSLQDKVFSSFSKAIAVFKETIGHYAHNQRASEGERTSLIDKSFPILMSRLTENTPRLYKMVSEAVVEIARSSSMKDRPLLLSHLLSPVEERGSWKLARGRVEVVEQLVNVTGLEWVEEGGVGMTEMMKFANSTLKHSNTQVRECAVKLTVVLYKHYGSAIVHLLSVSRDAAMATKNPLWRNLYDQFDRIDGTTTANDTIQAAKKKKDKKLNKMKSQLDTLKKLTAQGKKMTETELSAALAEHDDDNPSSTAPPSLETTAEPSSSSQNNQSTADEICTFCGDSRPSLREDFALEQHYAVDCPLLMQCKHCMQVVEIPHVAAHWLNECVRKEELVECSNCHVIVTKTSLTTHTKSARCTVPQKGFVKCPLCHSNVQETDEGWRKHLMGTNNGCVKNPRRKRRQIKGHSTDKTTTASSSSPPPTAVMLRN